MAKRSRRSKSSKSSKIAKSKSMFATDETDSKERPSKMRLIGLVGAILVAVIIAVMYKAWKDKEESKSTTAEKQVGQYLKRAKQCTRDDECPDQSFCDKRGLCVSMDVLQPVPGITDGRGRAAEGQDERVTFSTQTQN